MPSVVGHLQAEQIGRPSLPLFSRTGPISGNQHLLTNFFSYKMYGKDNIAMQRVFEVHILQGGKRRSFLKIGRTMKCHWFPPLARILPHKVLATGRMNTNINSTIAQSHCSQLYTIARSQRSQRVRSETVGLISRACRRG